MIETLTEMNPQHRAGTAKLGAQILAGVGALRSMEEQAKALDASCDAYLQSLPPGHVVQPDEFGSFEDYCRMLARLGRPKGDDTYEIDNTTEELGGDIAKVHEKGLIYIKTRSRTPGSDPEYTLGSAAATLAVVIPDHPIGNRLALRVRTRTLRRTEKITDVYIADMSAQRKPHADTGSNTPIVIAEQEKVKELVDFAYHNPLNRRSASGKDSRDILWAMVEGDVTPDELGITYKEAEKRKAHASSGIRDVCLYGAPYRNYVPMLAPLCNSLAEVRHIITSAQCSTALRDPYDDLTRDYQRLCDLYTA